MVLRVGEEGTKPICGGTLVANKYVISAAHCFIQNIGTQFATERDPSVFRIRVGDHNWDITGETSLPEKTVKIAKLTHHPRYDGSLSPPEAWDLTVVELAETLDLETYTPACMAKTTDANTFDGKTATQAGWGLLAEYHVFGGPPQFPDPFVPHEVELPVLPASECPGPEGSPSDICAGGEEGKGNCQVGGQRMLFYFSFYNKHYCRVTVEDL